MILISLTFLDLLVAKLHHLLGKELHFLGYRHIIRDCVEHLIEQFVFHSIHIVLFLTLILGFICCIHCLLSRIVTSCRDLNSLVFFCLFFILRLSYGLRLLCNSISSSLDNFGFLSVNSVNRFFTFFIRLSYLCFINVSQRVWSEKMEEEIVHADSFSAIWCSKVVDLPW